MSSMLVHLAVLWVANVLFYELFWQINIHCPILLRVLQWCIVCIVLQEKYARSVQDSANFLLYSCLIDGISVITQMDSSKTNL